MAGMLREQLMRMSNRESSISFSFFAFYCSFEVQTRYIWLSSVGNSSAFQPEILISKVREKPIVHGAYIVGVGMSCATTFTAFLRRRCIFKPGYPTGCVAMGFEDANSDYLRQLQLLCV